jgi:hypothetical protein
MLLRTSAGVANKRPEAKVTVRHLCSNVAADTGAHAGRAAAAGGASVSACTPVKSCVCVWGVGTRCKDTNTSAVQSLCSQRFCVNQPGLRLGGTHLPLQGLNLQQALRDAACSE